MLKLAFTFALTVVLSIARPANGQAWACPTWFMDDDDFMEWYGDSEDTKWADKLPDCPDDVPTDGTNCDSGTWTALKNQSDSHPGSWMCMRSKPKWFSLTGQQCCYELKNENDDKAYLMKYDGPPLDEKDLAPGTPDKVAPPSGITIWHFVAPKTTISKDFAKVAAHCFFDVRPWRYALEKWNAGDKSFMEKYLEKRPPNDGGGTCIKPRRRPWWNIFGRR